MSAAQKKPPLGVIILGAGASSRMGRPKLLLPWQDTTIIGHLIRQWHELGAAQIAVVHRPNDNELAAELDRLGFPQSDRILNPRPERGMFSSIRCAANWKGWKKGVAVWAVVLGDQPHLRLATLRALLEFHAGRPGAICQPEYGGHARHPVLLPRPALLKLRRTRAKSLKDFLKQTAVQVVKRPIEDPGLALDLDSPADYLQANIY